VPRDMEHYVLGTGAKNAGHIPLGEGRIDLAQERGGAVRVASVVIGITPRQYRLGMRRNISARRSLLQAPRLSDRDA
jgi:hypothetical protein